MTAVENYAMNPNYAILFEPVTIGPVVAPNRFYQVPHASGMTEANPRVRASFRGTKAEGGGQAIQGWRLQLVCRTLA